MAVPLIYPALIPQPFALNGSKNVIPTLPDATPGHASLELGFPPLTMTPIESGGVPPSGLDMNGIINLLSQHDAWAAAGGQYTFNATLAAYIDGYSIGKVLQSNDGLSSYVSLVNNNVVDFNTTPASIGVQWAAYAGAAASGNVPVTVNTTGGTTTLTTAQAQADIIIVTGVLASAATIVFPPTMREWKLINGTTGAFGMVAKIATGQSLTMTQGQTNTVFYNGTQLVFPDYDSGLDSPAFRGNPTAPTQADTDSSTRLATTAFAKTMRSPAFVGTPTVPTAAAATNTTQVASTAFVQAAVAAATLNIVPQYVNGAFVASVTGDLWTDTSAGGFPITLPDPPVGKNIITFRDIFGTWSVNNLTINPGTKTVLGTTGNFVANVSGRTFGMWYDTTAATWKLI